jgi:hypothetical protein
MVLGFPARAWVVVVVSAAPEVERVVEAADDGAEDAGAAVWSAVREAQPVTARAAPTATVAMIRTGPMVTPPTPTTLWAQDTSLAWAGHSTAIDGRRGMREPASIQSRCSIEPSTPPTVGRGRRPAAAVAWGQALTSQRPRPGPRAPIP